MSDHQEKLLAEAVFKPLGDSALIVQIGIGIHPNIQKRVYALSEWMNCHPFTGFIESVPAYNNVTIFYHPIIVCQNAPANLTPYEFVCHYVKKVIKQLDIETNQQERCIDIPVLYGGKYGPDLEYVAQYHNLSVEEVIMIHSREEYLVYMLGFAPGFPFLGGMDEIIATPRKKTPRLSIEQGSVGIAGKQTGIYPLKTPGGWQIIGRTPLSLFHPSKSSPTLLHPGDKIRFVSISQEEFDRYREMSECL
ncbi:inhibitor of KinA [Oikeobacillus pervagus]|uniref:Inhibitor of KinA n=1 Tax=Oikeobacillus pervagus TaxID=1325931 RepID=A0AAJ1SYW4_9BACI|nr:5-oxoprolinase subunit PxpB [Oikeobacillus pervagus]MDQ0215389.1 inhibitor of KinA [Oikeobacillus pervagus]